MIQSTRVLLLSSLLLVSEPSWEGQWLAVEEAGQSGELVCFDLNHRPGLWPSESDAFVQLDAMLSCTDILKVNESELLLLTGTKDPSHGIPRLLERGVKLAAVTLGERGSYYGTQRIQGAVPAYRVDVVDPLGCGDIFTAALLVRLLEHNKNLVELTQAELEDCFRFANAAGALAATKRGTIYRRTRPVGSGGTTFQVIPEAFSHIDHITFSRKIKGIEGSYSTLRSTS